MGHSLTQVANRAWQAVDLALDTTLNLVLTAVNNVTVAVNNLITVMTNGTEKVRIIAVDAGRLKLNAQGYEKVTCALVNTDYMTAAAPAYATYALVFGDNISIFAFGTATTAAVGLALPAGGPQTLPITRTEGDSKVHVQSPTAGAIAYVSWMTDL